jgi:hypothetical protein
MELVITRFADSRFLVSFLMLHQFFCGIQACGFRPSLGVDWKGFESWFARAARISELVDSLFKASTFKRNRGTRF